MPLDDHKNRLIVAAAGSGKTTYLARKALECKESVLITTYTLANESEIKKKIVELNKFIPGNITVQTFFSFLLQHGVRPYQGYLYKPDIKGMLLVNEQSGVRYKNAKGFNVLFAEDPDFERHYFTKSGRIFSDKISKFIFRANNQSAGEVINRLTRIYSSIFFDEIQDMAGYDLEIIKLLFGGSSNVLLVGDPRQVTYLTHHDKLHKVFKDGRIEEFILEKCKKLKCFVDKDTLNMSHRNNAKICFVSSRLYDQYPESKACTCMECRAVITDHEGVFVLRSKDLLDYQRLFKPTTLRYSGAEENEWNYGASKGLGFERVLIFPTKGIVKYLTNGELRIKVGEKVKEAFDIAKFYVALTRARRSVAIVMDFKDGDNLIEGIEKFIPDKIATQKTI
jgi:superfamily I DNA/RNA helicase